ncbi:MAG: hypothetical protein MZV64_71780 [Ignavibacteriales bacterium]|nr:hypothetical protein [Ignavibacteriales bacterium]
MAFADPAAIALTVFTTNPAPRSIRRSEALLRSLQVRLGIFSAEDDLAGVRLLFKEECGNTRLRLAVDDCPVDQGRAPVLRQQRGMQVESPQGRQCPDLLRHHPESNDYLEVGRMSPEVCCEMPGLSC